MTDIPFSQSKLCIGGRSKVAKDQYKCVFFNQASSMALGMTTIGWIDMRFAIDIHVLHRVEILW